MLKNNQSLVSPLDKMRHKREKVNLLDLCSRCGKKIKGNKLKIKPTHKIETRKLNYYYIYHLHCIRSNWIILRLNFLHFSLIYKWYRLKRGMIFLTYFKH